MSDKEEVEVGGEEETGEEVVGAEEESEQVAVNKLHALFLQFRTASIPHKCNELGKQLTDFLTDNPEEIDEYFDIRELLDGLQAHWLTGYNPKVIQFGLEALSIIAERLGERYRSYEPPTLIQAVTSRFGDHKVALREAARSYFIRIIQADAHDPNDIIEKLLPLLDHKNSVVAIEAQKTIMDILYKCRDKGITNSTLKTMLDATINSVAHIYLKEDAIHIMKVLMDPNALGKSWVMSQVNKKIAAKESVSCKLSKIVDKLNPKPEEVKAPKDKRLASGKTVPVERKDPLDKKAPPLDKKTVVVKRPPVEEPTAEDQGAAPPPEYDDEPDYTVQKPKRAIPGTSKPKPKQATPASAVPQESKDEYEQENEEYYDPDFRAPPAVKPKKPVTSVPPPGKGPARPAAKSKILDTLAMYSGPIGEVDEEWFEKAFEDVEELVIVSPREFDTITKKIIEDLKGGLEFWEAKLEAMKKARSVVLNWKNFEEETISFVHNVNLILVEHLADTRSQVQRETFLTFAFFCKTLKSKLDVLSCEVIMTQLMSNVQNHIKVISVGSTLTLNILYSNVFHGRLITELVKTIAYTKSRERRTVGCELLLLVLQKWPQYRLEQQFTALEKGVRVGLTEGSIEGRVFARKAFWLFREKFPEQGDNLLRSLDRLNRKKLESDRPNAAAPPAGPAVRPKPKPTAKPAPALTTSVPRPGTSGAVELANVRRFNPTNPLTTLRSNSAIDLHAVQRAKARQQYAALTRSKAGCVSSLPRPIKKTGTTSGPAGAGPVSGSFPNEQRTGRARSRAVGVSHSQPSSRSGSPSSRLVHVYHLPEHKAAQFYRSPSRVTTPRSQGSSRETSPHRLIAKTGMTNIYVNKNRRAPSTPSSRPTNSHKLLSQSMEAEGNDVSPLYDAVNADSTGYKISPRRNNYRPFEDHSDDSDASSLCSERSFDSYRRTSDDIVQIIHNCESTEWTDRKDGLVALQSWFLAGNVLNPLELAKIVDLFTRMFLDNHTKVFSLFLDTLYELLQVHRGDLNHWLYVLLTRLLNKMGCDLLESIKNKILKCLELIRDSFPKDLQMSAVLRFLVDPTQTPNLRVKISALNFLTKLAPLTDPSQAFPPQTQITSRDPTLTALHKMIGWIMGGESIKQGGELRKASQEAVLALFNLNTPQVTLRLANLPQEYQEAAATLLQWRVRRGSTGASEGLRASSIPPPQSPRRQSQPHAQEPANPEEVYRSLQKTTAEIQSYTYETVTKKSPDRKKTASKAPRTTQMSDNLEEVFEGLSLASPSSNAPAMPPNFSPLLSSGLGDYETGEARGAQEQRQRSGSFDEQESLNKIVEALKVQVGFDVMAQSEKRATLNELVKLIRDCSTLALQYHLKPMLRILLGDLSLDIAHREVQTMILVLTALSELIKRSSLTDYLNAYVELLILKVINASRDPNKDVSKAAEGCAMAIASTLTPETVMRVLVPLIQTKDFPFHHMAIKMLTRLVDSSKKEMVRSYVPEVSPGLLVAIESLDSSVRKSAVLAIVSLTLKVGDHNVKPHMKGLSASKEKLLDLYVKRSRMNIAQGLSPPSPRSDFSSSS